MMIFAVTQAQLIEFVKQRVASYKYPRTRRIRFTPHSHLWHSECNILRVLRGSLNGVSVP
jgi:hypothetical protein